MASMFKMTFAVFFGILAAALTLVLIVIGTIVVVFFPTALPAGIGVWQIPAEVSYRASVIGDGDVIRISHSRGLGVNDVQVICRRPSTGEEWKHTDDEWMVDEVIEIGPIQGWDFIAGDELIVFAPGFRRFRWSRP